MSEGGPLVNIPDLSKPATVLIEKVSDAVGGILKPWQIRRVARAEADADKIKALAQVEVTEIQQRALARLVQEEGKRQENIENITAQAIPNLQPEAKPEAIEDDWLAHFFERCRLVSDVEMQSLWARLLAGQANKPSSISKRTIELVSTLDKADAHLFTRLCGYGWNFAQITPLIYDVEDPMYAASGLTFTSLSHLDSIGLLSFQGLTGFVNQALPRKFRVSYFGTEVLVEMPEEAAGRMNIGKIMLTRAGNELAPLCGAQPVPDFLGYVLERWRKEKIESRIAAAGR